MQTGLVPTPVASQNGQQSMEVSRVAFCVMPGERHGLTLLDVARKGDLNSRTIERWENGILHNFDAVRLRILRSALEVDHRLAAVALGFVDPDDLRSRP